MECHLPDAMHCTSTTAPAKSGLLCFLSLILPLHQDWGSCTQQTDSIENFDSIPNKKNTAPPKWTKPPRQLWAFSLPPSCRNSSSGAREQQGWGCSSCSLAKIKLDGVPVRLFLKQMGFRGYSGGTQVQKFNTLCLP